MAISEFEIKKFEKELKAFLDKRRPPVHMRHQVDIGYRVVGQSVEIFETRSAWEKPKEKLENAVAKATFVKAGKYWKVYWMRADLKWHRYQPMPSVKSLQDFLVLVDEDAFCCFWG